MRTWPLPFLVLPFLVLALAPAVANHATPAASDQTVYRFRFDGKTATVAVDRRPYRMTNVLLPWRGSDAPIVAHISGAGSPYTILARPAYGLFYKPGEHVYVTMSAKYDAVGDSSPSQPLERGVAMKPDVRRRAGTALVRLFLDRTHPLVFSILIRSDGFATTRLVPPSGRHSW